jgi:hypothetical protein
MRRNVLILSLLGIALLAVPGSAAAKRASRGFRYCADANAVYKAPRDFVGDGDALVVVQSPRLRNCSFGLMAAHHLGYYRFQLNWGVVEFMPGFYNFVPYDQLVTLAAEHHMRILFDLIGEPSWESSAPPGAKARAPYPPRDPQAFAQFAALAVQRYGPGGTFWRAHPNVPYYPVRTWEVWQEMNLKQSWADPNMRAYVRLLRPTYTAIKRVDRHSTVIAGGMSFYCDPKSCWGPKSDEWRLITNLYRYGARGYFDALGIHPYATTLQQVKQRLLVARRIMNQHGDRSKGLWITEVGWSGGDPDSFITNARRQRSNIVKFFHWAERTRAQLKLRGVIWYGWQDKIYAKGPKNWWGFHLGLLNTRRQPKPALAAISAAARVLDRW